MTGLEIFYLVAAIASIGMSIYAATRPQPKVPDATVQTGDSPTAQEGRPIPVVFGTVLIRDPNIVWFGETGTIPIKSKGQGKK